MPRFKKIYIETTNICNLSCDFCPSLGRKKETMSIERFEKILEGIKGYTDYIYLHLMGEPLSNPNLKEFLDLSLEYGYRVNITTNGTLIKRVADILINSKAVRQVNVSLHSFEANNKQGVEFEKYYNDVMDFTKRANEETGIIVSLRLWNMDRVYEASNELNQDILKEIGKTFELDYSLEEFLKDNRSTKLKDRIYLGTADKFEWPSLSRDVFEGEQFCHGLRDHVGILVDGTVVPCCLDSEGVINLGDILNEDFGEIINSPRAKKIYDGFSGKKAVEDLCKRCGYINRKR